MENRINNIEYQIQKNRHFQCMCDSLIAIDPYQLILKHVDTCQTYQEQSPINKIFKQIPLKGLMVEQLITLHAEFNNYTNQIMAELRNRNDPFVNTFQQQNNSQQQSNKSQQQSQQQKYQLQQYKQQTQQYQNQNEKFFDIEEQFENKKGYKDPRAENEDLVRCVNSKCNKYFYSFDTENIWYIEKCCHLICRACLSKSIMENYILKEGQIKCMKNDCVEYLDHLEIQMIIGKKQYQLLEDKYIQKLTGQFTIQCTKQECQEIIQFMAGQVDLKQKNDQGILLTQEQAQHYANNRFTCPRCRTEQCKECKKHPYHNGYTCQEWKQKSEQKSCRYCADVVNNYNKNLPVHMHDICQFKECVDKLSFACQKLLLCGHACPGFKGEVNCPPCFQCQGEQQGDDYCNICFIEGLQQAPIIKLGCNHVFHLHCISKRLDVRWITARIVFNFCLCPLCKIWMELPQGCSLKEKLTENLNLFQKIQKMSLERLKYEQREKDERLVKQGDIYYQKPLEYALAIYSYYLCFKCKGPYFGGLKSCDQGDAGGQFNPEELICAGCCGVFPAQDCKTHGKDFIEYKCKFCCNVAQWFCWNTTHFCEPCHKRQCSGDYVSKYTRDKLPSCKGKDYCQLKCDHPPNGEEFALGCALCRNNKENVLKF